MKPTNKVDFVNRLTSQGVALSTAEQLFDKTYAKPTQYPLWVEYEDIKTSYSDAIAAPKSKTVKKSISRNKKLAITLKSEDIALHHIHFINTVLMQCALPKKELQLPYFQRKTGIQTVRLSGQPDIGLPYGKWARMLIIYVCTQIKQTKSKEIFIGDSLYDFVSLVMGSEKGSKYNHSHRIEIADQAKRLFTTTFTVIQNKNDNKNKCSSFIFENIQIAQKGYINFMPAGNWESKITITEEFYQSCMDHSAPINSMIVTTLQSVFAIDIYCWLCFRLNSMSKNIRVSWIQLMEQFCDTYANNFSFTNAKHEEIRFSDKSEERAHLRYFKRSFMRNLELINSVLAEPITYNCNKTFVEIVKFTAA